MKDIIEAESVCQFCKKQFKWYAISPKVVYALSKGYYGKLVPADWLSATENTVKVCARCPSCHEDNEFEQPLL